MVNEEKLNQFIGKILGDLGGAFSVSMVRMGDKLGLYKALNEQGPMTAGELAAKTNVAERYAREWLSHQAASGYLDYDPANGKFTLPPEQAMVFAEPDSPVYLQGAFDLAVVDDGKPAAGRARVPHGQGRRLGRSVAVPVLHGRALLPAGLSQQPRGIVAAGAWTASTAKLERGAKVADVGCGHGFSTIIMAKAFPNSTFVGYDFHPNSIEQARVHAEQHGVTANTKFEVAWRATFPARTWTS